MRCSMAFASPEASFQRARAGVPEGGERDPSVGLAGFLSDYDAQTQTQRSPGKEELDLSTDSLRGPVPIVEDEFHECEELLANTELKNIAPPSEIAEDLSTGDHDADRTEMHFSKQTTPSQNTKRFSRRSANTTRTKKTRRRTRFARPLITTQAASICDYYSAATVCRSPFIHTPLPFAGLSFSREKC